VIILETPRLNLIPLTRTMMTRRLETDTFSLSANLATGPSQVNFLPSWPGDALGMFRGKLKRMDDSTEDVFGSFAAILLEDGFAVAQLGIKGTPNEDGDQEIGYGFNEEVWGRGLATEAVTALSEYVSTLPGVQRVTAETATTNPASARVLEKVGFVQSGTSWDEEDGDLLVWAYEPASVQRTACD
jgi:ribosomal-protein-alanine N-acetyltransferase